MDDDDELMMLFFRVMTHVWSCGIPDHIIVITPNYSLSTPKNIIIVIIIIMGIGHHINPSSLSHTRDDFDGPTGVFKCNFSTPLTKFPFVPSYDPLNHTQGSEHRVDMYL
jgi:hypothetical protein